MKNWIEQSVEWDEKSKINYFMREMNRNNTCKKNYYAHIFLCDIENEEQLKSQWSDINNRVAVFIQSQVESIIERSNFYLCFFVKKVISLRIQSEIENDTFCAKKYIFYDEKMDLEKRCHEVERKIFSIEINSSNENITKLKEIQLKNFRAFKNRNQIKLCEPDGNIASLVAIYAKNGVGKTSIFDGVEFALKGKVNRFEEIEDKEVGAIYHNRENLDKEAFVDLILENNKEIKRNVGKVGKRNHDMRKNSPVLGKGLVGEAKQWEQTILPHDKIDNFISAKSGEERYREWIESTGLENEYNDDFVNSYSNLSDVKNEIEEISKNIKNDKEALESLKQQTDKVELWKNLINQYNRINEENKIQLQTKIFDEKVYDNIINMSSQYIREYKKSLENIDKKIRSAETVLEKGVPYYINCINRILEHEKEIYEIDKKIINRKKYDVLLNKIEQSTIELKKIEKELLPINGIIEWGFKNVILEKDRFDLRKKEIKKHENLIELRNSEKKELRQKIDAINHEIKLNELRVNKEKEQKELLTLIKEWENYPNYKKNLREKLEAYVENEKEKSQTIENHNLFLAQLKESFIPETIDELSIEKMAGIADYFDADILKQLKNLKKIYENTLKEIRKCQQKNEKIEQNQKELEKLVVYGRKYLNQHQSICKCPLCHTDFENWEKLFHSVNSIQENDQELVQNELKNLSAIMVTIKQLYNELIPQDIECKKKLEDKKKIALEKEEKERQKIIKLKNDILTKEKALEEREEKIERYFIQENIKLAGTVEEVMKLWFEDQYKKLVVVRQIISTTIRHFNLTKIIGTEVNKAYCKHLILQIK